MELRNEMNEIYYKGQKIPYIHSSFYCDLSGENFTTIELDELNMERIISKYKLSYE